MLCRDTRKKYNARPLLRCFLVFLITITVNECQLCNYVLILTKENNEITFYIIDIHAYAQF